MTFQHFISVELLCCRISQIIMNPAVSSLTGGIVTYKSPILLKGAHDNVIVNLVDTSPLKSCSSVDKSELDELKQSGLDAKEKMGSS